MEQVLAPMSPRRAILPMFVACSMALHGGALAVISQTARWRRAEAAQPTPPLELVVVEVEATQPPPIEEAKASPPMPTLAPPIKVASVKQVRPRANAPPPPNDPPPPEAAPRQAPLMVGLSMSSTTTGAGFAAPVGNTLYGKTEPKAHSPEDVQAYAAPRFVPVYQVDSEPTVLTEVKIPYPERARREGIEGTVLLSIVIDADGKVVSAKILTGPGHGLDELAREAIGRFRFKPAIKAGQPVSTELKFKYTFSLN